MDYFNYRNQTLYAEDCDINHLASLYGTPLYIYSRATIERHWHAFDNAAKDYDHLICYAVKANSNLAILQLLAQMGSGFDIVSGGELARVLKAGGDPSKVVFSGVGKTHSEIEFALEMGIYSFNVESEEELLRIETIAHDLGMQAPITLRVNPDIDAQTHPYISTGLKDNKFGIAMDQANALYQRISESSSLLAKGIACHIGSQLTAIAPFLAALDKVLVLVDELHEQGIHLTHLDVGGGLGVTYDKEAPPHPKEYAKALIEKLAHYPPLTLVFEPGRAIMANAGILVTRVEYLKTHYEKSFAIVDAAMNDFLRPALYDAWQQIVPVNQHPGVERTYDIVGPVCETGDFLGKDRTLTIESRDLLAIRSTGAYGYTMASNYNSRCKPAEIIVDQGQHFIINRRQKIEDLWQTEIKLSHL